jgi:hypothetical protein
MCYIIMDNTSLQREYESYLEYMLEYEEENGYYPPHLSDGHWMPLSFDEWIIRVKKFN